MTAVQRPPWCPDNGCTPISLLTDSDNPHLDNPGLAVTCFGVLAKPIDWEFNGVEHHETLSDCHYSPLKGVVRWLENLDDWSALASYYRVAGLRAAEFLERRQARTGAAVRNGR